MDKIQKAIEWQESLAAHHQEKWETSDTEDKLEPGAQAQHDEMMASFELAKQALIDRALAEPSDAIYAAVMAGNKKIVRAMAELRQPDRSEPSDAVQRAIDAVSGILNDNGTFSLAGHYQTIIAALRQYQKPTDEAVQRAIELADRFSEFGRNPEYECEISGIVWDEKGHTLLQCVFSPDEIALAIAALRQMKGESK